MASETLQCKKREKVGSRDARKLRSNGRIPASLQTDGSAAHVNLHFDAVQFLSSRRHHIHLYDLDIEGDVESAVVRELQWDALGDHILHVEFKRVQRGVETESEVELSFYGQVKEGVLNHNVTHITILSLPSLIPDSIEVVVEGLEVGTHIKAGELTLPEGIHLAVDPELEIAVVGALRAHAEDEPVEEPEEDLAAPPAEDASEGGEPRPE